MIEHQKAVAKSVLNKLQTLDLYVVLAGGACRDWWLDKEATDLDFYLYYNPKYHSSSLKDVLVRLFGDIDGVLNMYNAGMPNQVVDPKKANDPLYPKNSNLLKGLKLNKMEMDAVIAFLDALTSPAIQIRVETLPK